MATGYDLWLTTDPSDDGTQEAIDAIRDELALDAEEVEDAAGWIELPASVIAGAFIAGTDEAWALVRQKIEALISARLDSRAIDVFDKREEESRRNAAEARADWERAA